MEAELIAALGSPRSVDLLVNFRGSMNRLYVLMQRDAAKGFLRCNFVDVSIVGCV